MVINPIVPAETSISSTSIEIFRCRTGSMDCLEFCADYLLMQQISRDDCFYCSMLTVTVLLNQ
jgi:hypothetical protein